MAALLFAGETLTMLTSIFVQLSCLLFSFCLLSYVC